MQLLPHKIHFTGEEVPDAAARSLIQWAGSSNIFMAPRGCFDLRFILLPGARLPRNVAREMPEISTSSAFLIPLPGGPPLDPLELLANSDGVVIGPHDACDIPPPPESAAVSAR